MRGGPIKQAAEAVFALASGDYSDYRVHCVVRGTKGDAEMLAARANADGSNYETYFVEELPVAAPDVQRVEVLVLIAEVRDAGPNIESEKVHARVEWPFNSLQGANAMEWRWVRAPVHNGKGGRLEVWGSDHERVRKVYSDTKAMLLSEPALRDREEATGGRR